jgi:hypothetical protein
MVVSIKFNYITYNNLKTMKVKEELNLEVLLNYGFTKIDKEEETENEQYTIALYDYKFEIGYARRGQFYYLLVGEKTRDIIIYATKPDGGGGSVMCPDVLIKLSIDGVVS